jgi:HEAT repeat protein
MQGDILGGGYPPPVARLLTLGDPRRLDKPTRESPGWPNYLGHGLGPEYIPDLIRLAGDEVFNEGDPDSPEVWGPLHAWRALGQLHATEAVAPLLDVLSDNEDDDWVHEELPYVFALIGPAAIAPVAAYLADATQTLTNRLTPTTALEKITEAHPAARDESVRALARQLEAYKDNDPELNGFIISSLVELKAVEAAPLMQQAFESNSVDLIVLGDWDDARLELGLIPARVQLTQQHPTESRNRMQRYMGMPSTAPPPAALAHLLNPAPPAPVAARDTSDKAKKKAADKQRKRNKKRK